MTTAVLEPERTVEELPGDVPSRLRLIVTDTSGNNQLGLIWGLRSRYYDSSATAALFYEAEALTPVNGAAVITGVSGASGGKTVAITGIPSGSWVSMLATTIAATTGNWTHQGSYRVWARCYSATGTPQLPVAVGRGLPVRASHEHVHNHPRDQRLLPSRLRGGPDRRATRRYCPVARRCAGVLAHWGRLRLGRLYLPSAARRRGGAADLRERAPRIVDQLAKSPSAGSKRRRHGHCGIEQSHLRIRRRHVVRYGHADQRANLRVAEATGYGFSLPSTATIVGIEVAEYWNLIWSGSFYATPLSAL